MVRIWNLENTNLNELLDAITQNEIALLFKTTRSQIYFIRTRPTRYTN